MEHPLIFGLGSSAALARHIADAAGLPLCPVEEREFEDGEHKARPLAQVAGRRVVVVQSLYGEPGASANDKLIRLLFFVATLRDHGALDITVLAPYLCYGRKERRTKPLDPVPTRYVGQLFEAMRADAIVTLDVHNQSAFDNAFRCRTLSLEPAPLFVPRLAELVDGRDTIVLAPDAGAVKRADAVRSALAERLGRPVDAGLMEKRRTDGVVSGDALFADVDGRFVVIVDDMISTGTTLVRAAQAARAAGAATIVAAVSHGLFNPPAGTLLADPSLDRILVSDSVPPFRLQDQPAADRVEVLGSAALFGALLRGGWPGA